MPEFLFIEADEEGKVGKTAILGRFGHVIPAALEPKPCFIEAEIVAIFNRGLPHIFAKQPTKINLTHIAKLGIMRNRLIFLAKLGKRGNRGLKPAIFRRNGRIALINLPKKSINA